MSVRLMCWFTFRESEEAIGDASFRFFLCLDVSFVSETAAVGFGVGLRRWRDRCRRVHFHFRE